MKIHHVQAIFSKEHGGPAFSLRNYCRGLASQGHDVQAWVLEGYPNTSPVEPMEEPVRTHVFPVGKPSFLGESKELRCDLRRSEDPDLFYMHGVWLLAMHHGASESRRRGIPYIYELMGMYESYPLSVKPARKKLFRWLFQDADLRGASCLHVSSKQEARDLRELGFENPIAIIPVGVNVPDIAGEADPAPRSEMQVGKYFLFLSRIHEKKGIEMLLHAWANLQKEFPDYRLMICGAGGPEYVERCRKLTADLGLTDRCDWIGPVTEEEKSWAYRNARFYVLPSFSENYGNTVAEALVHGTPVLTTDRTPWDEVVPRGCGWIASVSSESVEGQLRIALGTDFRELRVMGRAGREWALADFSLPSVIHKMNEMCRWVVSGGGRPTFFVD